MFSRTMLPLDTAQAALQLVHRTRTIASRSCSPSRPFQDIPGPQPLPLVGNFWRYLPIIGHYKIDALYENGLYNRNRYGPIVREELTKNHTILHLFDPADIESLFRQDSKWPKRRSHRALLKYRRNRPDLYLDGGLFPENGQNWYRQRSLFRSHLSKTKVARLVDKIWDATTPVVEEILQNKAEMKVEKFEVLLYRWALANSLSIFLDCDISQLDSSQVDKCIHELHSSLAAIEKTEIYSDKWVKKPHSCPFYRKLERSQDFLHSFVSMVMEHSKQKLEKRETSYLRDFLLVDRLDERDVTSFVIDSLMAGLHTTSYTVAHLLYHIANNPDIQDGLRGEIDALPKNLHRIPAFDEIDSMTLLKNCLKETLRLNPISIGTGRVSHEELTIRNYRIPAGTMIITQNQVISRDPQFFKNSDSFEPDRWLEYKRPESRKSKPSPFAVLPFGFGPRSCLGRQLALLQTKILTIQLLSSLELMPFKPIPTKTTLVHVIDGNVEVEFRRRKQ